MKGKIEFTQDEIDSINSLLNSQIKLS